VAVKTRLRFASLLDLLTFKCPHDLTQGNYHTQDEWPTNASDDLVIIFYKGVGVYLEETNATRKRWGNRNSEGTEKDITMKGGAVTRGGPCSPSEGLQEKFTMGGRERA
jgi:hypothetical protein